MIDLRFCSGVLVALVITVSTGSAFASCGLTGCTIEKQGVEEKRNPRAMFDAGTLFGSYNSNGEDFNYWNTQLRAEASPWKRFRAALTLPFGVVSAPQGDFQGIGDLTMELAGVPLIWGEGEYKVVLGSQLEFPTGNEDEYLGSGHYEVLPFATLHVTIDRWMIYAQNGGRFSVGSGAHDDGHTHLHGSVLDPHSDREFLYRAGFIYPQYARIRGGLSVSGQTVLEQEDRGTTFVSVMPEMNVTLVKGLSGNLRGEIPVTPDKRFDWRVGFGLTYAF